MDTRIEPKIFETEVEEEKRNTYNMDSTMQDLNNNRNNVEQANNIKTENKIPSFTQSEPKVQPNEEKKEENKVTINNDIIIEKDSTEDENFFDDFFDDDDDWS